MEEISHHIPEEGFVTRELIGVVNDMIRAGKPDAEVVHVSLQGLFGVVGQLEAARRKESD